ncbi:hypothetical protein Sjap_011644 [Stephania japonica]|uniref:C3H1-type domain-containing protein n=1 Tax=Stephania japonica TaxID=461633 RepID=A0AAP0JBI7_9MAGN
MLGGLCPSDVALVLRYCSGRASVLFFRLIRENRRAKTQFQVVPSMAPPRILLCGDPLGRLSQLYKRVAAVAKSAGPFDLLFCVGQFFPDSPDRLQDLMDYIDQRTPIPIPTYFVGDYGLGAPASSPTLWLTNPIAASGLGGLGFATISTGSKAVERLCVAYLSGRHSSEAQKFGTYTEDDIDALRAWAEEPGVVDFGVSNRADISEVPSEVTDSSGCDPVISKLVAEIKPRYHIAGTKGIFYAREPYSNDNVPHVTRFLGLAPVGNKDKQKFIHAISPTPASTMSAAEVTARPANTTLSPYTVVEPKAHTKEAAKRPSDSISESQYWRYDVSGKRPRKDAGNGAKLCFKFTSSGSCSRGEKCNFVHDMDAREQSRRGVCFDFLNKGKCERTTDCKYKHNLVDKIESATRGKSRSRECWFCLSSLNVESHLLLSIGENWYCALAKGALVLEHVLLMPIEHLPNTLAMAPEAEAELARFKKSLKTYCKRHDMEVVFFEWVFKHTTHANLQFMACLSCVSWVILQLYDILCDAIPIPLSKVSAVQEQFNSAAEKQGFKFVTTNSGQSMIDLTFGCSLLEGQERLNIYYRGGTSPGGGMGRKARVTLEKALGVHAKALLKDHHATTLGADGSSTEGRKFLKEKLDSGLSFFYAELPEGKILSHSVDDNEKFPVQFGREVLAGLLDMPDRADWRACSVSKEEETQMAEDFKKRFKEFDPNQATVAWIRFQFIRYAELEIQVGIGNFGESIGDQVAIDDENSAIEEEGGTEEDERII